MFRAIRLVSMAAALAAFSMMSSTPAVAATDSVAQQKIGYVDIEEIQFKALPVKQQIQTYEKKFGPKVTEAEKNMKRQQDLQREAKNTAVLSSDRREEIRKELDDLKRKLNDLDFQITNEMQKEIDEVSLRVGDMIMRAIKGVADANGFTLVLTKSSVVYGSPSVDLTPAVIQYLNKSGQAKAEEKPKGDKEK